MDAEQQLHRRPGTDTTGATTPEADADTRRTRRRGVDGQLRLLNTSAHPEWKLDDATRAVGRRGVAQARAALRAARGDHAEVASPRSSAA